MDSVVALLPIKANSQRVPGKNFRLLGDRPLYRHILETLRRSERVSHVFIDTDSDQIHEETKSYSDVTVIPRPEDLRADDTPMTKIIRHDLTSVVPNDVILQTHATNPFLKAETIDRAVSEYFSDPAADSLAAVTRLQTRLYYAPDRPINHDPRVLLQTQDLPPVYEENSNLYIFRRELILERGVRFSDRARFFEMNPLEAIDVDTEEDFILAEVMYEYQKRDATP